MAAQLPVVATGVPDGLYTASDKMMASFFTQLSNSMHDVQDQVGRCWLLVRLLQALTESDAVLAHCSWIARSVQLPLFRAA